MNQIYVIDRIITTHYLFPQSNYHNNVTLYGLPLAYYLQIALFY